MRIGVPREIKVQEFRVGMIPAAVRELVHRGHEVFVQESAGEGSGFADLQYIAAGARMLATIEEVYAEADLIVKIKEPQPVELGLIEPRHVLFTYLHLAPDRSQTVSLQKSGAVCIAYETVTDDQGSLPLLSPMSEVAGKMAVQVGATYLQKSGGGRGVLMGGVPGVEPATVVVLGDGVVGFNALLVATGMGANGIILGKDMDKLREIQHHFGNRVKTVYATKDSVEYYVHQADLLVGAVLIPGAEAPRLVTEQMVREMKEGAVIVDVSIDQGGCVATSRPTTHQDPVFEVEGVIHYCVTNMPGAVARTSTMALTWATLPFVLDIADKGVKRALMENKHLRNGLNICRGRVTCRNVADAQGHPFQKPEEALNGL